MRGDRLAHAMALIWLATLAGLTSLADLLPLPAPDAMDLSARSALPSPAHPLGTDALGRDLLSRTLYGARVALWVGIASPLIGLAIGGVLGVLAGFAGGRLDRIVSVLVDTLLALPAIAIAMLFTTWFEGALGGVVLALGLLGCPFYARVARSGSRRIASQAFVEAAQALGASTAGTLWRHVVPNLVPALTNVFVLLAAVMILLEGALSYLGLSVRPPTPTWGGMIADGRGVLEQHPHVMLVPVTALVLTVLSLNVLSRTPGPGRRRSAVMRA